MNLKNFSTFLLFLGFFFQTQAQILKNSTINLNTGGLIYDAVFIPENNTYVVVGEFTSINGVARKNIAILNSSFAVQAFNPITSIDGTIKTVDFKSKVISGTQNNYLAIGGDFTVVNGLNKQGLLLFTSTGAVTTTFTLNNWNYCIFDGNPPSFEYDGIKDLKFYGDTLMVGGSFYGVNLTVASPTVVSNWSNCFFALKMAPATPAKFSYITSQSTMVATDEVATGFIKKGNDLYVSQMRVSSGGTSFIEKRNTSLNVSTSLSHYNTPSKGFYLLEPFNDSLFLSGFFGFPYSSSIYYNHLALFKYNGTGYLGSNAYYLVNNTAMTDNIFGYTSYNNDLIQYKSGPLIQRYKLEPTLVSGNLNFTTVGVSIPITNPSALNYDSINNLQVLGNYLLLSDRGLTQVNGTARTGAAIFCLEPKNPTGAITGSNPVCAGSIGDYSFNDVEYNTGYRINYSGTNAQFSFDNGVTWISTITNYMYVFAGTGAPVNFKVKYLDNATSGTLTVTPFNTCNTSTDYQYAKSLALAIAVNPKPTLNISASETMFNCIVDSTIIVATSNAVVTAFSWSWNLQSMGTNDTLIRFGSGTLAGNYPEGWYICNVVNENGCTKKDSVLITEDFTLPVIDVNNDVSASPASWTCNTTSMQLNATIPNTSIYWTTLTDTTVQFSNPHTITSYLPSSFKIYVTSTINGCTNNQTYQIIDDQITIDGYLPNIGTNISFDVDTLNCSVDSLNIACAIWPSDPNAASGTIAWLVNGVEANDSLLVTLNDSIFATNDVLVLSYVTTNTVNTCKDTNNLTIIFDTELPFIGTTIGGTSINCSVDEVGLSHQQTGGQVSEGWLDNSGNQTFVDTLLATNTGDYFYEVTNLQNGCKAIDTVTVLQTNELYLSSTNDTLVCPGSLVNLQTSPINEVATFTYSWSSGGSSNQTSVTGGNQTVYVDVTSSTGCIGQDSIVVSITPPIVADFQDFIGCGDNSGSLQVVSATGGAGNYTYAINGGTFGTATLFEDLSVGQHQISIQDGLGCVYDFTDSISANAQGPELEFLVATFSQAGDTLALVNTTIFTGFDSVAWVFPAGITVTAQYDSLTFIHAADTGWYEVTLVGYIDTCSFSFTKEFHVDNTKPLYPEFGQSLRIQSTLLYPNPTTGTFNLEIEFGVEQDYSIIVVNNLSQPIIGMSAKGDALTCDHTFSFPSGSIPGMYQVIILSTYDARTLQVELTQ